MQTLTPGKKYHVELSAYDLHGEFEAVFLRVDGPQGDDHAIAIWSNDVRLEMWGWDSNDELADYGWRATPVEG